MPKNPRRAEAQQTLDGFSVPTLPKVRTSRGHIVEWDRERIVKQILNETQLVETFYGGEGADESLAREIALDVENKIKKLRLTSLSGPLVREILTVPFLSAI